MSRKLHGIDLALWLALPIGIGLELAVAVLRAVVFFPFDVREEIRRRR